MQCEQWSSCTCHLLSSNCYLSCTQDSDPEAKLSDIWAALSDSIRQDCSCSLSMQQSLFSCLGTEDSETVVYIAELSYTVIPGVVNVPSLLTSWIDSGPTIIVNSIQLQVDTTCPVVIDSLKPESCIVAPHTSSSPPTDTPTDPPANVTVIAVVTCVILLLVVVTIVAAIVVAVAVFRRKQSKYKYVPTPHHHSIHTTVSWRISVV